MEMKKISVVAIILLFIGVAVAPGINTSIVKASQEDDLIEVTSQACGIQGFGDTTVKLTREQYQNLEEYLVEFRARLNQTTTREEAIPIFKDAVVELDKYGLLPKGMNVERAQRLVVGNLKSTNIVHKMYTSDNSSCGNLFCLIAAESTTCRVARPLISVFRSVLHKITANPNPLFAVVFVVAFVLYFYDFYFIWMQKNFGAASWINFLNLLTFGEEDLPPFGPGYGASPSTGWIFTAGLNGIKTIDGSFWGHIQFPVMAFAWKCYTGAFGSTGIKLLVDSGGWDNSFFLGTAIFVNVDDFQPPW